MFAGFDLSHIKTADGVVLRVRNGGRGPPLVLLHGHPRTHATWHKVAPLLADRFTVVCPDLRGYGRSTTQETAPDHNQQCKRAMAADVVELMRQLGHDRFAVVGHDRGAYVAFRLALDRPDAVSQLVVLDAVPILEVLERCDARFAERWWHWFFFSQAGKPERAILADPNAWYGDTPVKRQQMGDAWADYQEAIHDPATVHAMLEDYRAGLGLDRQDDLNDRLTGRKVECPTLVMWAKHDDLEDLYGNPLEVWKPWIRNLEGRSLPCGHHMAEEMPALLADRLAGFVCNH